MPQTAETIDKVLQTEAEGEKYLEKDELDKALVKFQEAYGQSIEMKYRDGEGRALTDMCRLYLQRGQNVKSKELGENAIEVLYESSDKKALGKARVALAQAYFALENPTDAGRQLDMAMKSFADFGNSDAPEAAKVMNLIGNILVKLGKMREAMPFFQGAASYFGQAGDHAQEISNRLSVAGMMGELGWLIAAKEEAEKGLAAARDFNYPVLFSAALARLAGCEYNLGDYAKARKTYEEALQAAPKNTGDLIRATLEAGYGNALVASGDLQQGKEYLQKAYGVLKTPGSMVMQCLLLNGLGNIEELQGHHGQAIRLLAQALELQGIARPKQDRLGVVIRQNLAAVESRDGDNRNAKAHLESALGIFRTLKDPALEGRTYAALGEVCLYLQDPAQAQAYLKKGIAISEKINDDAALWREYTCLSNLQLAQGEHVPARDSMASALSFLRSPQAGAFPCPERLGFPSSREDLGQQLVAQLASQKMDEQALLAAEQLKEESFINDWLRRGGDVKPFDRDVYMDLVEQRSHLHAAENSTSPDKLLKDWQNWLVRFRQLATTNRTLARLIAPVPTAMEEIVREARDNQATIIDYLVGAQSTVVFTIDSAGRLTATRLPVGRNDLQNQVASLLGASARGDGTTRGAERRTLQALYNELLPSEVESALPGNPDQTVVIIPDGVLFNLPFAALVDQQGKYLVENHTLTMASSMGVFLESPPRSSRDLSLVVAAGGTSAEANGHWEANQISSLFEPDLVTRLVGKDAEISNLQEQAKARSVLHFPTKLALHDASSLRSELPLLAGKESTSDKVTAERLFGLNLPSDLAVWSATSINAKDMQGNAVKLFSRGLGYAGVRNVLMSLWVEPDPQRTSELVEFYRSKQKGLNQAQSLRRAQMLALSKDPSPRAWAAFQLLGPGN